MATSTDHPVRVAVGRARSELAGVTGSPVWSLSSTETVEAIADLQALKAQVAEIEVRLLSHAESVEVPTATGATSVANWLAHTHRLTRREAHRSNKLAAALDSRPVLREALAEARVNLEQAHVITGALDDLPDDLGTSQVERAEQHLIGLAADFDATALRNLGRRLFEVIAPEEADAREAAALEDEERRAAEAVRFTMTEPIDGQVHGRFTLDALTAAMLKKHLMALAAPKHRAASGPLGERRPTPQRLGQAFAELIQRYPKKALPKAGGVNATVVVTMTLDSLLGGLEAAKLDTGETISASLARRLACEAGIIPAVLGGKSEVLDLGRSRRFHSRAQRIAATVEQRGCIADGCDTPPALTHLHHPVPWSAGGETNRDGQMLCPAHHRRAHDPTYRQERMASERIAFHRRE